MNETEIKQQLQQLTAQSNKEPDNPEIFNNLGVGYYLLGEYEKAIRNLEKAVSLKKTPSYLFNLANAYSEHNEPSKAIDFYLQALDKNPNHIGALNNLADAYETVGESKKAHKLFTYITKIEPDEAMSHFNLGNFFLRQNQHIEAAKCYELAIERNEQFADAYHNIAWILYQAKAFEESKKYIKKGLAVAPDNEELNDLKNTLENR